MRVRRLVAFAAGAVLVLACGLASAAIKEKSKSFTVPGGTTAEETVKCKRGQEAVAGGFLSASNDVIPRDFVREGKRRWRLRSNNLNASDPGSEATVDVICAKPRFGLKAKSVTDSVVSPFDSVSVRCSRSRKVVFGGFEIPGGLGPIVSSSRRTSKREWTVATINEGSPHGITVTAYCDKRDDGLKEKTVTETLPNGGNDTITARCARGQRVVSGGYDGEFDLGAFEIARTFGSRRAGRRKWQISGYGNAGDPDLTAYAYCEKKEK